MQYPCCSLVLRSELATLHVVGVAGKLSICLAEYVRVLSDGTLIVFVQFPAAESAVLVELADPVDLVALALSYAP